MFEQIEIVLTSFALARHSRAEDAKRPTQREGMTGNRRFSVKIENGISKNRKRNKTPKIKL